MRFGWFDILLAGLAGIVFTLLAFWAWDTFRTWLVNREYSPDRRRGPRDRRQQD
jgi:uncharacterized membrane protein YbaN (DUF454 family)